MARSSIIASRRTIAALTAALCVGSLLLLAGPAASQSGPDGSCTDTVLSMQAGFGDRGQALYSDTNFGFDSRRHVLVEPIPAGTYDFNAVSYDGYLERDTTAPQPNEQWFAQLLDADGNVLAQTGATADLEDLVLEDTWTGPIGTVSWDGPDAVAVFIVHAAPPGATSPNSVEPVCLGATPDPVDITQATTTTVASTPTTEGPEVLPRIITPPALPQVVEPQFTG